MAIAVSSHADSLTAQAPTSDADADIDALSVPPADAQRVQMRATRENQSVRERSLVITATAYNSLAAQTDSDPTTAAWGDALTPGMKAIAVSRDLIPLGLDHRAPVSIEGLPGKYRVLDKMNGRWSKRIDIYMGNDVSAARAWGRREVWIHW